MGLFLDACMSNHEFWSQHLVLLSRLHYYACMPTRLIRAALRTLESALLCVHRAALYTRKSALLRVHRAALRTLEAALFCMHRAALCTRDSALLCVHAYMPNHVRTCAHICLRCTQ